MMSRALMLSAISSSASSIADPLTARDSALMVAALQALGVRINTTDDSLWAIHPGAFHGSTTIDCGLAGTVMRFVPPLAGLVDGDVTFDGDPAARRRPMGPLLEALSRIGVDVKHDSGGLPFTIAGTGSVSGGHITIDASASSQFVSGLLLSAPRFGNGVTVTHSGAAMPSTPHIRMTVDMLRDAGAVVDDSARNTWRVESGQPSGRAWSIEPDLSNAAPFIASALVTAGTVTILRWPHRTSQPGDLLRQLVTDFGGRAELTADGLRVTGTGSINGIDAELSEAGELTPVIAALCALADSPSSLRGIAHLRGHETDRLAGLRAQINGLGGDVIETPDGLRITPSPLKAGVFETYDDHRMAHAAAVIGLVVPGVELSDVACTTKTLPQFPQMWDQALGH